MSDDLILAHRVEGDGEPLLLLNGGMMTYAAWEPISSALSRRFKVVLCDLRGQLLSPGRAPGELSENVADLTALLDHLEVDSVHVLGASYGGEIGLLMAALAPERVRSLIAVTVSDMVTDAIRKGAEESRILVREALEGGDRGRIHDRVAGEVYSAAYRKRHGVQLAARRKLVAGLPDSWFESLQGIFAAVERMDLRPHLARIRCPTLVVIAADDRSIPPARSLALAAAIERAEIKIHETSGHALVAEDPEWLVRVALDFLSRQRAAKSRGGDRSN